MAEQTNLKKANLSTGYVINSIICVVLMVGFRFIPPIGSITEFGMEILGIFLGSIYGWVFVGFIWPSFLGMLLLGLSDYGTTAEVFKAGFGDSVVLNMFLAVTFFEFINKSGLLQYMANRLISLKVNANRPWMLIFSFFFIASYISAVTNCIACIILLWFTFYNICDEVGYKPGDKIVTYMVAGIAFFCTFTMALFPFVPWSLVCIGLMSSMADFGNYSQLGWTLSGSLIAFVLILAYMAVGRFIFKVDTSKLSFSSERLAELKEKKMGRSEKLA